MKTNMRTSLVAAAVVGALAGCATARVSDATHGISSETQPAEILVDVTTETFATASEADAAQAIRTELQADLVKDLTAARVLAEPIGAGPERTDAAVLHVTITEAAPGSALKRLVIGLGAGRAQLQAAAELRVPSAATGSLVSFNTSSDSGRGPGLLVPGGVALATGAAVHLAIGGGIDLAENARGGFGRPLKATARTIVDELKKYYGSVGWSWPTADQVQHS